MNIRKGNPEDMKGVLALIQELADFEIALYYYRYSTWKGKTIHLEDLVVKQNMRGTGLGYALYSEVIKQGKKDNVRRIEWAVLDWNTAAIEFYTNSGAKVFDDWRVAQMDEEGINYFLENKLK
jgi:GNAT superfamily N-acetyltransferase